MKDFIFYIHETNLFLKELTHVYNKSKLSHKSLKYNDNLYIN